ncbi:hypothetical protein [Desulfurococcus mucosus]|uniref:hypothetical protein n=1 Tax=Desulfurococcus mucosus TaxID=2275 RepID=UPI00064EB01F|nr:hypothetical protein [Desulfurococcus mucosus]
MYLTPLLDTDSLGRLVEETWRMKGILAFAYRGYGFPVRGDHYFSFTNSPYYSHRVLGAVDIYPPRGSLEVASPFTGRLIYYRVIGGEHVAGFEIGNGLYVRVLHVKPYVELGGEVEAGGILGECTHSPTFREWTDPHVHVEVREKPEFLRARGCVRLTPGRGVVEAASTALAACASSIIEGRVALVEKNRYILIEPPGCRGLSPVVVKVNGALGFLEGGVPHYGHGGVVVGQPGGEGEVRLQEATIGRVVEASGSLLHFTTTGIGFKLSDGARLIGLGVYLNSRYVKAIPVDWATVSLNEGDHVAVFPFPLY